MIRNENLESKDFSLVLPELIAKIQAVGSSFINISYMEEGFIPLDSFWLGFGTILNEVVCDLEMIEKALYSDLPLKELKAQLSQLQAQLSP